MNTENSMVAVFEDSPYSGVIVGWRLRGVVLFVDLCSALYEHGVDPEYIPDSTSYEAAFGRAVRSATGTSYLVRALPDCGWTIKSKHERSDEHGADLDYATELRAWLDREKGTIRFEPETHPLIERVRSDFVYFRQVLTTRDVSLFLIEQVNRLGGIGVLRDGGGTYFLPQASRAAWQAIVDGVRTCSAHRINQIPCVRTDSEAIAAILDGITNEVEGAVADFRGELSDDSRKLGLSALKSRKARLLDIEKKITRYETIVGSRLDTLRNTLEMVGDEVAFAMVACVAEKEAAKEI